jgi:hypothetical protein
LSEVDGSINDSPIVGIAGGIESIGIEGPVGDEFSMATASSDTGKKEGI